jgi:hypothetical protein
VSPFLLVTLVVTMLMAHKLTQIYMGGRYVCARPAGLEAKAGTRATVPGAGRPLSRRTAAAAGLRRPCRAKAGQAARSRRAPSTVSVTPMLPRVARE